MVNITLQEWERDDFKRKMITPLRLMSEIYATGCFILRFQRLCTHRSDFEERTKLLGNLLLLRGYKFNLLEKQFCRVIDKYIKDFQKWAIPLDLRLWFKQIFRRIPTNSTLPQPISMSFSQPINNPNLNIIFHRSQP